MNEIVETLKGIPAWAGSVPGWIMAVSFLGILWRGLPSVLDAWSNSVAREREHREREIERLEGQIRTSDERHAECMDGQRKLREEIERRDKAQEVRDRAHADEVQKLRDLVSGLMMQLRQFQLSGAVLTPDLPSEYTAMLKALESKGAKQ